MRHCLALVLAASAASQTIHHVGPGQTHPEIAPAIAAALPGDVIAIHAGWYLPFTLDKGLTLRAEPPFARVYVIPAGGPSPQESRFTIPPGQHARCADIVFLPNTVQQRVVVDAGLVSFDNCTMTANFVEALAVLDAAVVLQQCTLDGSTGLLAQRSHVAVLDSFCSALYRPGVPGAGIDVTDGTLHASRSWSRGALGAGAGGHGVHLRGSARAWLVDCSLSGGSNGLMTGQGGNGLCNQSTVPARLHRCTATGGNGAIMAPAPPINGAVQNGPLLGVATWVTPFTGATWTLDFASEANRPVVVVAALSLQAPATLPQVEQLQWGFLPPSCATAGFAIADAQGHAVFQFAVPANAALRDLGVWFTGASGTSLPLQVSPPTGGVIR